MIYFQLNLKTGSVLVKESKDLFPESEALSLFPD
jgi:hypothetical protein